MISPSRSATVSILFFMGGIWFGTYHIHTLPVSLTSVSIWLGLLIVLRFSTGKIYYICCFVLILSSFWSGWTIVQIWKYSHNDTFTDGTQVEGEMVITDAPDVRSNKTYLTAVFVHNSIFHHALLLSAERYPRYEYGQHIWVKGSVEHPQILSGFNYPLFLQRANITGLIRRPTVSAMKTPIPWSFQGELFRIRDTVEMHIAQWIPEPESSFLSGILLGSKRAIPADVQADLQTTGTTHIIAISGANITILLDILLTIIPVYSARNKFLTISVIALFVATLTGGSASVVRGASVAILGSGLAWLERRRLSLGMILVPAGIILITNPLLLSADPGFQLSFAAYAGLLGLNPFLQKITPKIPLLRSLPPVIQAAFIETTAASLGTAPVSLINFGRASPLGLIVNPLILWLLPPITFLGLLLISIGWIQFLARIIALPLWFLLHTVLTLISSFARLGGT